MLLQGTYADVAEAEALARSLGITVEIYDGEAIDSPLLARLSHGAVDVARLMYYRHIPHYTALVPAVTGDDSAAPDSVTTASDMDCPDWNFHDTPYQSEADELSASREVELDTPSASPDQFDEFCTDGYAIGASCARQTPKPKDLEGRYNRLSHDY